MNNLQTPTEYQKMRTNAINALICAGVRIPSKRQIAVYILTGKVAK